MESIVLIQSGENLYGINSETVYSILDALPVTPIPLADNGITGVCSVNGKIAVCIDFNFIMKNINNNPKNKMLIIQKENAVYAFLVEDVSDIKFLESENFELSAKKDDLIEGFYKEENRNICQILNIDKLLYKIGNFKYTPLEIADVGNGINKNEVSSSEFNTFIIFQLNNEFFAIEADIAKEVLFPESKITSLAESDELIKGVATVRGNPINVVDFNFVLNKNKGGVNENSRFLIIHNEFGEVALLVDRVIDIKDIDISRLEKNFGKYENRDKKIEGLYDDGEKIVSVVSSFLLKDLINRYSIKDNYEEKIEEDENMIEVAAFKIGGEEYAIDIDDIQETIKYGGITPIPATKKYIKGVINLRGEIIPVLSLPERLGFKENIDNNTKIIVCQVKGHKIGLLVDDVSEILFMEEKFVSKNDDENAIVKEIINIDNGRRVILKLNLTTIIDEEELKSISSASEIENSK